MGLWCQGSHLLQAFFSAGAVVVVAFVDTDAALVVFQSVSLMLMLCLLEERIRLQ